MSCFAAVPSGCGGLALPDAFKTIVATICASFLVGGAAHASLCDAPPEDLIFAACGGQARVSLRLLPEDAGATPPEALDVTGAYTASDRRSGDKPKPVGLLVRNGEVISREYVRFDGLLTVDAADAPMIHMRSRVSFGGSVFSLNDTAARAAFLTAAADAGADVLQSHLLIIDGAADVADQDGAPQFRRRIMLQMTNGDIGIFDSSPRALTLHDATKEVAARFAPKMALNLDMGSYDFCRRGDELCGLLTADGVEKLSNLLRFSVAK